jgi:hypothetical protein
MLSIISLFRSILERLKQVFDPKCRNVYSKEEKILETLNSKGYRPLIVHCMPKVGSMTIIATLKAINFGNGAPIYRPHFYSPKGLEYELSVLADWYQGYKNIPRKWFRASERNRAVSDRVLKRDTSGPRWKIITMVREPVVNNISSFFHNHFWWPKEIAQTVARDPDAALKQLTQLFFERYPHDQPLNWFDLEVLPMYGLDVYATSFPTERGYQICATEYADVLLIRLESLKTAGPAGLSEFLGIDNITLVNDNLAEDKWYNDIYRRFMKELVLPEEYLDRAYSSKMARHFYSEAEIEKFRKHWSRK